MSVNRGFAGQNLGMCVLAENLTVFFEAIYWK